MATEKREILRFLHEEQKVHGVDSPRLFKGLTQIMPEICEYRGRHAWRQVCLNYNCTFLLQSKALTSCQKLESQFCGMLALCLPEEQAEAVTKLTSGKDLLQATELCGSSCKSWGKGLGFQKKYQKEHSSRRVLEKILVPRFCLTSENLKPSCLCHVNIQSRAILGWC